MLFRSNTEAVVRDFQTFIEQGRDLKKVGEELDLLHVKRKKFQFIEEGNNQKLKNNYRHLTPNGDFSKWAYSKHFKGEFGVFIFDTEENKLSKIAHGDFQSDRIPDESTPQLAWHPNGNLLAFITEKNGRLFLNTYQYDSKEKSSKELFQIEKILSMTYSPDGKNILLSGTYHGKTNVYILPITANVPRKITDDN